MFIVDLPSPTASGWCAHPAYTHTIGHHHPIVAFESVRVPATHMVGREGGGMAFAYEWFRYERIMVASRCLGAAARLIDEATDFATRADRQRPADHRVRRRQAMLADSLTELFAARAMVYETARNIDAGADLKVQHTQCSMAKLYASEMANRVADRCVQIFGGRGYMRENVAERFFRELRVERIWEGTSEVQRCDHRRPDGQAGPGAPSSERRRRLEAGATRQSDGRQPTDRGRVADRLTQVAAGDHGHELVHGVLLARQRPGPGVGRGQAPLDRGAGVPVLLVGDVPEVRWRRRGRNRAGSSASGAKDQVHSIRVRVGGQRGQPVGHDVVGVQADQDVREDVDVDHRPQAVGVEPAQHHPAAADRRATSCPCPSRRSIEPPTQAPLGRGSSRRSWVG